MYPLWGLLLSFPLWTVSCVDNKYDLDKDIDMTINVGGEHLTLIVMSMSLSRSYLIRTLT